MNAPATLLYRGTWTVSIDKEFILHTSISAQAKVLWMVLKSFCAPDSETAFPSLQTLCLAVGVKKDTLLKYRNELRDLGLLEITQSKKDGCFSHNIYTVFDHRNPRKNPNPPHRKKPATEEIASNTIVPNIENDNPKEEEHVPSKPVSLTKPDVNDQASDFVLKWQAHYRETTGQPYCVVERVRKRELVAVQSIIRAGETVDGMIETARRAWTKRGKGWWNCETKSRMILTFVENLPMIRGELANDTSVPADVEWNEERIKRTFGEAYVSAK